MAFDKLSKRKPNIPLLSGVFKPPEYQDQSAGDPARLGPASNNVIDATTPAGKARQKMETVNILRFQRNKKRADSGGRPAG